MTIDPIMKNIFLLASLPRQPQQPLSVLAYNRKVTWALLSEAPNAYADMNISTKYSTADHTHNASRTALQTERNTYPACLVESSQPC